MTDLKVGKKTSHDGKLDIFVQFERTGSNCDQLDEVLLDNNKIEIQIQIYQEETFNVMSTQIPQLNN